MSDQLRDLRPLRGAGVQTSAADAAAGFRTDGDIPLPPMVAARACACGASVTAHRPHARADLGCVLHGRRLFTGLFAASAAGLVPGWAWAQSAPPAPPVDEGLRKEVGKTSVFVNAIPPEQVEQAAAQQFRQMAREAQQKNQLAPPDHPQVVRLRAIAQRIIPFAPAWNPRAREWKWDVQLFGSAQVNAFCMPGGKIAFYWGILSKLQLSDDEVAMIMGHEVAHALREHARERMGKQAATRLGANLVSSLFGLGQLGDLAVGMGAQLLTLKFSRDDETEADLVGLELAARAGYNPEAGVTLWQKMLQANKGAPPEFMSTHPAGDSRIQDIQKVLPRVQPLYARAPKPEQVFGPPSGSKG
jgi:Zn-dependent protease with chaperone function